MEVLLWLLQLHREVLRAEGVEKVRAMVPIGQQATAQAVKLMTTEGNKDGVCEEVSPSPLFFLVNSSATCHVAAHHPLLFTTSVHFCLP